MMLSVQLRLLLSQSARHYRNSLQLMFLCLSVSVVFLLLFCFCFYAFLVVTLGLLPSIKKFSCDLTQMKGHCRLAPGHCFLSPDAHDLSQTCHLFLGFQHMQLLFDFNSDEFKKDYSWIDCLVFPCHYSGGDAIVSSLYS